MRAPEAANARYAAHAQRSELEASNKNALLGAALAIG